MRETAGETINTEQTVLRNSSGHSAEKEEDSVTGAGSETGDAGFADLLEKLERPEIRQSLNALIDQLPQLSELGSKLAETYALVRNMGTDPVFVADLIGGIGEIVTPVVDKAKDIASAVIEAQDRASADTSTVGLFGLLRMLKDPQTQKALRFTNALLKTLNDREYGRIDA